MVKNDIVAKFENEINELVSARPVPELQERYSNIEDINNRFLAETGHILPSIYLSMLADWILLEVLNSKDVDKVSNTEYAILSHRQLKRRDRRENSVEGDVIDFLNLKFIKQDDRLSKKGKAVNDQ